MKRIIIIASLIIILILFFVGYSVGLKIIYPQNYFEYVEKYANEYQIENEWIFALIKAESNFNEESISSSGAIGLMQLMESTAEEMASEIRIIRI